MNQGFNMRFLLGLLLAFGFARGSHALDITTSMLRGSDFVRGDGYVRYATHEWEMKPEMLKALEYGINKLCADHQKVFGKKVSGEFSVRFRVFGRFEDYKEYSQAKYKKEVTENLLGFFSPRGKEIVTWRQKASWRLLPTLLHEGSHAIMDDLFGALPFWMIEGSADWFGEPQWIEGNGLKLDKQKRWLTLNKLRDEYELPPMKDYLLSEGYDDWKKMFKNEIGMGYDIGWSIFDFFMSHPQSTKFMAGIVNSRDSMLADQNGYSREGIFAAYIQKHWPGGIPMFEKGWHSWVKIKAEESRQAIIKSKTSPK